ncbi:PAS domain-containing sensor histidine kinase [Denitrobaculum tricleocarpae]|uniref:Nitrogen regulation protein n=1 Tax=Denitrobaculum tricleocarpae TaxID=2591009 RepID=A0A545TPP5_9PROT|nr:PAS domain-containing sensor histidine kinase [Denitrobaculum tricleocarpae]
MAAELSTAASQDGTEARNERPPETSAGPSGEPGAESGPEAGPESVTGPGAGTPENTEAGKPHALAANEGWVRRFGHWAHRHKLERKVALFLLVAAIASGIATFAAMTDSLPVALDPLSVLLLLNLDLILLLGLSALVARRLVIIWVARRRGMAGARLHARLVGLFSLVAVMPTIIVATLSFFLLDFGLQGWFSERVSTAVKESFAVANAYLEEHRQTIGADVLAMAQDISREGSAVAYNPQRLNQVLGAQAALRSLTEAMIVDSSQRVIARAGFSLLLDFDPQVPEWALRRAQEGEIVILTSPTDDRVRGLVRLDMISDTYLYVGRLIDPRVLGHIDRTQGAVRLYEELEGKRSGLQLTFTAIFVVVALMLLLASIWVGLAFANQLTVPVGRLIDAAGRVSEGDLTARVPNQDNRDEIGTLGRAFNRMTGEIQRQQDALLDANTQLDERSRFIEAVLGGVSAGVLGLDGKGVITLVNKVASELLERNAASIRGSEIGEVLPDVQDLVDAARKRPRRRSERQITLSQSGGRICTMMVRVVAEQDEAGVNGFVVTLDDISELMSAQRKAAWSDVARRIAHEIKNPLTPIQLSAERLKRKYLREITSDPDTFEICTDTIVRQVGDIGRMVDEFSSFARMPAPVVENVDIKHLAEQAVFLQKTAHPEIDYEMESDAEEMSTGCDRQQINRVLTNLLLNAEEAIEGRQEEDGDFKGRIKVRLRDLPEGLVIEIEDNGKGLPEVSRDRLTEPYVTTRKKGTGLGLAIVKKIMEDHGGSFGLQDAAEQGAVARLVFPRIDEATTIVG